jgi:hypothetical protein
VNYVLHLYIYICVCVCVCERKRERERERERERDGVGLRSLKSYLTPPHICVDVQSRELNNVY